MEPGSPAFADAVASALRPYLPEERAAAQGRFCAALARAHARVNLTAVTGPGEMAVLHVLDSLLALPLLEGTGPLVDLGSGGGVPGLPLALALPERPVVLVESRRRKARALQAIVDELGLGPRVSVVDRRGEEWLVGRRVDTVVTRALGPVDAQLRLLGPVRGSFRRLVLFKGPAVDRELTRARARLARGRWGTPRRLEADLPGGAGHRVLLAFEGALEEGPPVSPGSPG